MRLCWESALKLNPTTAPSLTVRFVIDPTGHVASVEPLSTNARDPEVDRCVLRAVKALVFPAPEGPGYVTVTYPFIIEITGG
jgi:TonB family protein